MSPEYLNLFTNLMTPFLLMTALVFGVGFLRKQQRLQELQLHRDLDFRATETAETRAATAGPQPEQYAGYSVFQIPDEHKNIFSEAMQGFTEYAKLKGYNISFAVDATLPGKVGIKFTIMDAGVTVSTATVKKDVDEYINKLRNADDLGDMPIVTDPVEHTRLVSAIGMRFTHLRHEADLHAMQSTAYRKLFESVQELTTRAITYSQSNALSPNFHIQVDSRGGHTMSSGDTYRADHSPGAAVGRDNKVRIEASSIIVGSSNEQRASQGASVDELLGLVKSSKLLDADKSLAVRHLENVKEEIGSSEPDKGVIAKSLERFKSVFTVASVGAELYEKGKSLIEAFGVAA